MNPGMELGHPRKRSPGWWYSRPRTCDDTMRRHGDGQGHAPFETVFPITGVRPPSRRACGNFTPVEISFSPVSKLQPGFLRHAVEQMQAALYATKSEIDSYFRKTTTQTSFIMVRRLTNERVAGQHTLPETYGYESVDEELMNRSVLVSSCPVRY